ncbi:MAG: AEC family transporter, partial [Lachnospiraceae bacterium]|nr:AEC family transporter [Lachnospiraceae bacterium]
RILDIPIPAFIDTGISKIGGITSPLSMMIIGTMLVGVDWKGLFEPVIFYFSAIRLILLPIMALGLSRIMGFDDLTTGVSVVMTAMPAGSTTALLAAKYGADEEFASRLVVSTTVMSLVTAPLLMLLI